MTFIGKLVAERVNTAAITRLTPQRAALHLRMFDLRISPDTSIKMFPFLNNPGISAPQGGPGHENTYWQQALLGQLTMLDDRCKSVLRHDLNNMISAPLLWPEMEIMQIESSGTASPLLKDWQELLSKARAAHKEIKASSGNITFPNFLFNMTDKAGELEGPIHQLEKTVQSEAIHSIRHQYDRMVGTLAAIKDFEIEELLVLAGQAENAVEIFRERTERQPVLSEMYRRQYRLIIELGGTNYLPLWEQALLIFGNGDPAFTINGSAKNLLSFLQR